MYTILRTINDIHTYVQFNLNETKKQGAKNVTVVQGVVANGTSAAAGS